MVNDIVPTAGKSLFWWRFLPNGGAAGRRNRAMSRNEGRRCENGVQIPVCLILVAAAMASGAGAQPVGSAIGATTNASLHTPDLIAPAVLTYLACLYAARGLPLLRGSDGRQIGVRGERGNDCTEIRRKAQADAIELIGGKTLPDGVAPDLFVEEALTAMDRHVASLPAPSDRGTAGALPMVTGTPVTIEDEVKPAYARYNECLGAKASASASAITAANVLRKFSDALNACTGARAAAVEEAQRALVAKGWSAAARKTAADNSFNQADQSWTTMGRRLHDALVQRDSRRKDREPPIRRR